MQYLNILRTAVWEKGGRNVIKNVVIVPTGDELKAGIILDTDSPMIMQTLLKLESNCAVTRLAPIEDREESISLNILNAVASDASLVVLIGGSGGGHRHSNTLGKDFTHSSLELILEKRFATSLFGKNGHLWSKLVCGTIGNTLVINVPGPFQEAKAAIEAFVSAYGKAPEDLEGINREMAEAVRQQYGSYGAK